ncbi:MAG: ATP-dependent zinc metalloprotease FtsH [Candidatus Latescibacterota bacterium]|nr:ATP-dependent zinc metalloprotease FtsH [Candidatus Latescibacterota bacterium]
MENKRKEEEDRPRRWRRPSRTQAFWIFLILVLIFAGKFFDSTPSDAPNISYRQYREFLEEGKVVEAVIVGESEFHGILNDGGTFVVNLGPIDGSTKREWQQDFNLDFKFKDEPFKWSNVIFSVLPWVLFLGFWVFMLRQMQGGSRGLFSFGKSRAKILTGETQETTFDDVAGADEAKEELSEIIDFLKDPERFQRLGGRIPKGVLMVGPPGTGKTHLARAISGEAGVPFFSISGSDFVEMFVGVGASRVRDLFEQGKNSAPCIIFVDEIDAVGRQRGAGIGGGHDEREQTLNQLLVEMDGFQSNDGVILIAATNRPDVLDPALLRPGRFDRRVVVDLPDVRGREEILKIHVRKVPLTEKVDLKRVAQATPGLSGADLANLINEAALFASRKGRDSVDRSDIEQANDKVMMGAERRSLLLTDEDKTLAAYHEAGHALVAKSVPESQKIGKATIIPRGQAMGVVSFLPDERRSMTETRLKSHLATALGGCCAERIIFSERSTGAQSDYKQVASLARSMVCDWGMNQELGPIALSNREEEVFLGKGFAQAGNLSEETTQIIDREIRRLVQEAETSATGILRNRIEDLHTIAKALLKFEVLDDTELDMLLDGGVLDIDGKKMSGENLSNSNSLDETEKL